MIELHRISDIEELMTWRKEVIVNVFNTVPDSYLLEANRHYYEKHIADGSHIAYAASKDGKNIGCGAICMTEELPSPDNPGGRCAYLMNIYVRESFRNHGVAHAIVGRLVEDAKTMGCGKIYLESTEMAKPIYREIGFNNMDNMMKYES